MECFMVAMSSCLRLPAAGRRRQAGVQLRKTGFRVKPGMTNKEKGFMTHFTGRMRISNLKVG
jgi:hypothetical protein